VLTTIHKESYKQLLKKVGFFSNYFDFFLLRQKTYPTQKLKLKLKIPLYKKQ
jgi:hypothetical protein